MDSKIALLIITVFFGWYVMWVEAGKRLSGDWQSLLLFRFLGGIPIIMGVCKIAQLVIFGG